MNRHRLALPIILIAACLVLAAVPSARAYDYNYARVVRLSYVDGDVQVARPQSEDQSEAAWEQAVVNLPIQQGYTLATSQGRAEIEFESGATARLAENSVLQFTELALSNGGRVTRLTLTQGTATFYAKLARDDAFVVATPNLQVVIPETARFRVDVSDDGTEVSAFKGEVEVDSRAGTNRLSKGYSLFYRTNDPDRVSMNRSNRTDDWDRWVADRDEVVQTGSAAALQYVSSPYSYGLSDLYNYGSWYPYSGYGLCWRPYGVGLGWSPFTSGRWAFLPGFGWTWVSYEPWGWMPYHFGGWVWSPALGWLWVPGHHFRQWQPATVTWVRVGDRIGWVPLAPNDRPGRTPGNLQHGMIVMGSNGFTVQDAHKLMSVGNGVEVLRDPPQGFAGAAQSKTKYIGPPVPGSGRGNADRTIVFDPKDRKFVNNPAAGNGTGSGGGGANIGTNGSQDPRGSPTTKSSKQTFQPPPPRAGSGGAAPSGERAAPQKVSPPPPPPARTQPPPPSPPRVQSSPLPKTQQMDAPRPAPAPRPSSFVSRPSSPPPSAPHSSESSMGGRSGRH